MPNSINTTVDLTNRKAYIVVEEGEQVECTFTSEPIAPSASYASISGRVLTADGRGVRGAQVNLLNASTNESRSVTTNTFGHFMISDLRVGDFYVVSIPLSKKRGSRNQLTQAFTLEDDLTGMDFVLPR